MLMIDIVIPIKDREISRLNICLNNIIKNSTKVKSIIVVDYNSKEPIKLEDLPSDERISVLRVENPEWNKAHALNLGILRGSAEYIMTVDCDMIISKEIFNFIENNLSPENMIIDTNVRRIDINSVSDNYNKMVKKSKSWFGENRNQFFNQANGGFQVYSREFYNKVGGLNEGLGFFMGAVDNFMYYLAKIRRLNIIDISYPLLHMEHTKQKEKNFELTKEEQDIALGYRQFKSGYLDRMINEGIDHNESKIGGNKPDRTMLDAFEKEYKDRNRLIDEAIKNKQEYVKICGQVFKIEKEKPSILICVINNQDTLPTYFVWDLFNLFLYTKNFYPLTDIQQIDNCDVSLMRNVAIKRALGDNPEKVRYKYMVMLDSDHRYPIDFLVKFLNRMEAEDIPILTGLTDSQKEIDGKHYSTQYYKIKTDINDPKNCLYFPKPVNKIVQVEASGPVGMVMNTKIFDKLSLPLYKQEYTINNATKDVVVTGSDIYFCSLLKDVSIPIKVDCSVSFPHHWNKSFLDRGKIVSFV